MDDDPRADQALTTPEGNTVPVSAPLSLHQITKRFGTVTALQNVSFAAQSGKITALLGENGAGKTTLMRVAFGLIQPDAGWIAIDGVPTPLVSPATAIAAGIGMVHQQFSLVPAMTVAENVALGGWGRYAFSKTAHVLREIQHRTGLFLEPSRRVSELSNAERQKLEIIRTFAHNARVLILDEPTAVLTSRDIDELFAQLKAFATTGHSVVLITHKLTDAIQHADTVTVLRHGHVVLSSPMNEATEQSLASAMLGRTPVRSITARTEADIDQKPIAFFKNVFLNVPDTRALTREITLEIFPGQIIGIAALEGAAAPLIRALAGRLRPISGEVALPERIGFVPENRRGEALIEDFSLTENLALANASSKRGIIDWPQLEADASKVLTNFSISTKDPQTRPQQLSGGNQQRFVLGRELRNDPHLLVLENPTQGLDISASAFVHDQIKLSAARGASVVFYSSDLDELASLADHVLIISKRSMKRIGPDKRAIGLALLETERQT